jgi:hypothetical protein
MDGKFISCEKDLGLTEGPNIGDWGDCTPCVKTAKALAEEKSEKGAKSKGEVEDLENTELKRQIASLVKQPRMIELMRRLKSMEETVG